MSIRIKLLINTIFTLLIVAGLAFSGIFGMRFVQKNISKLTQKSTPYQIKAIELEKAVQSTVSTLIRLNNSPCIDEMLQSKKSVEEYLVEVQTTQKSLKELSENTHDFHTELSGISTELIDLTTQRLKAHDEAARAGIAVRGQAKETFSRLKTLETQIKKLQNRAGSNFGKAISDMKDSSAHLRDVEKLSNTLKDLQLLVVQLPKAEKKLTLIAARGKITSESNKTSQNQYLKATKKFSTAFHQIFEKLNELIKLKMDYLSSPSPEKKQKIDSLAPETDALITPLFIEITAEIQQLNGHYSDEIKNQDASFASSNSASSILLATTDLVTAGMTINALSSTLLSVQEIEDINPIESELKQTFARVTSIEKNLTASLKNMNSKSELKLLQSAISSMRSIQAVLDGQDGMVAKVRKSLEMKTKSLIVTKKILEVAANATQRGKQSVLTARGEQETAIKDLNRAVGSTKKRLIVIGGAAFVFCLFFGGWLYRSITKPLSVLSTMAQKVQQTGDLSVRGIVSCNGEVGKTIVVFNALFEGLNNIIININSVMGAMAENDLTKNVTVDANGDLNILKQNINKSLLALQSTMREMRDNATSVATASIETTQAVESLATSSKTQLETVSSVADALTETSATISEIAQSTDKANNLATNSLKIVASGQAKMEQMVQAMDEIASNSERIKGITALIVDIADQTNLLALNAAIEAARAGEMGLGFAVVADEVKKLAERVTTSANEISNVVNESVKGSQNAASEAREVGMVMEQISESSHEIEGMLHRIAAAIEEQNATVGEINENVATLTSIAHENATASDQMSSTMNELSRLADETGQQAARFKL